jgi:hypothetical protein
MEFKLPSLEEQDRMVAAAETVLRAAVNNYFPKDVEDYRPFRSMVKTLLPLMKSTPASGIVKYHSAFAGGLLVHTAAVLDTALSVATLLQQDAAESPEAQAALLRSVVKAVFLHDIGKIGDGDHPYYLPQDNEWRRNTLGETYTINRDLKELAYLPVPMRGTWLAQKFGVFLTPEETQAILASDGPDSSLARVVSAFFETPLTMLVHFADKWVSQVRRA